jgi:hypothetical protein
MLDVAIVSVITGATFTIGATMTLEFQQPGADFFPLGAAKSVVATPLRWRNQTSWNGNGASVESVHV